MSALTSPKDSRGEVLAEKSPTRATAVKMKSPTMATAVMMKRKIRFRRRRQQPLTKSKSLRLPRGPITVIWTALPRQLGQILLHTPTREAENAAAKVQRLRRIRIVRARRGVVSGQSLRGRSISEAPIALDRRALHLPNVASNFRGEMPWGGIAEISAASRWMR